MTDRNDLRSLIEQYSEDMMRRYAHSAISSPDPLSANPTQVQPNIDPPSQTNVAPTNDLTDSGQLQVRVSTENQAIPLPGAVITVTRNDNGSTELIRTIIADQNGLTPLLDLPTKDRRLSLEPDHPAPYTVYTVDVTADGYFHKRFLDIPIYGGVTAVQNVSMIPLPEQGDQNDVLEYPQGGPKEL